MQKTNRLLLNFRKNPRKNSVLFSLILLVSSACAVPIPVPAIKTTVIKDEKREDKPRSTPLELGSLSRDGYQVVPVLAYHNIADIPGRSTDVSRDNFYEQMKYLHDNGYTTVTAQQLHDFLNAKSKIPEKSVMLTFDDGYKSIHNIANNIMKEFDLHGIVFIYTDAITGKYGANMSWDQIKQISKDVFEIQVHTKSHPANLALNMEGESEEEYKKRMDSELQSSIRLIEEKTGEKPEYLAYPYGKFSKQLIDLLQNRYDYKGAFTVIGAKTLSDENQNSKVEYGYNPFFINPFKIRRIQILRDTSFNKFKKYLKTFKSGDVVDQNTIRNFEREISNLKPKSTK